jgi:hypothetical protein
MNFPKEEERILARWKEIDAFLTQVELVSAHHFLLPFLVGLWPVPVVAVMGRYFQISKAWPAERVPVDPRSNGLYSRKENNHIPSTVGPRFPSHEH